MNWQVMRVSESKKKFCCICNKEIMGRPDNAKYCKECAVKTKKERDKQHNKARRTGGMINKNFSLTADTTQCRTCFYWDKQNMLCDYMTKTGMPRGCEPSPNCKKWRHR